MHSLETYLRELVEIHHSGVGVKETSYYPVLAALLNDIGKTLKPKVKCIIHLRSKGAGIPDGGLFTADQLKGLGDEADPLEGQRPARAVLEVKLRRQESAASDGLKLALAPFGLPIPPLTGVKGFVGRVKAAAYSRPLRQVA